MAGPLAAGDLVADYIVERIAGTGGMAVVAIASHRTERHRIAIKLMLAEVARRGDAVKRFQQEQRTLERLHSEHTLRIYGSGTHNG
ncbi:MAG: serine/threonine protein kinase, partial [Myxococcales bacterium]|nr:serine/threonine protein kinase [Myxococcales bacterium]